jgi:hypothetical protein
MTTSWLLQKTTKSVDYKIDWLKRQKDYKLTNQLIDYENDYKLID